MYKRILLAYDGSETGQKALLDCREMASWGHSELFLVAVMPPPAAFIGGEGGIYDVEREKEEEQAFRDILEDGLKRLTDAGRSPRGEVLVGDAVDEIVACARKVQADLIVVGHKHLEGWARRWWRGSISKSLVEHAPCSVLVVISS
ncbi:MAG TPA: universal stress protein [Usitatibacter sp.]|jgi:nucleotide-binding universal stress UspA family protein|nr:universal stress protein [Usitatibacter sp.]